MYATLGGRFNPAAFKAFDRAMKKSAAEAEAGESRIRAASSRMGNSLPLKAMDQWSSHSKQAGENLQKLGRVAATGAAVGIVALGAATVYAATKAVTFNREMLKISTQAGGSASEVKSLSQAVLGLAGTVPQGPQKLAEGLYHIESAGFRGSQAMSMLKASAMGAALGNADLQDTTQAMIATMASQIKGVHGSADAMGQLNAIVGVGDMRMQQLAQAMATGILPTAHDAGLSLKDVGAALATVTDNATPANVTATRLRMTLALMAAPSKAAITQLKSIGLTSTSLAHDMRQPNGLLLAVEDLKKHLRDSGKTAEEQDAILSHVFGGGKSSAVIHTLISETGRLRTKYQELGSIDGPKRLAKSWAEFQASNAATFGELKSGAEAFAITIGDVVLPEFAKLAKGAESALSGFVKGGGAASLGHDLTAGFDTAGQVISGLAPDVEALAKALLDVGQAGVSVGQFFGIGFAGQIQTAAAAFLAFKAAQFVAPMFLAAAGAVGTFITAMATAPTVAAGVLDLLSMLNPVTAIAVAVSAAAAAFVALKSGLFSSKSAAEENAAAVQADQKAIESLHQATQDAANAQVAARRADLSHKEAGEHLKQVEKEVTDGTLKGAAAQNVLADARLRNIETANAHAAAQAKAVTELHKETSEAEKASVTLGKRGDKKLEEIGQEEKLAASLKKRGASAAALGPTLSKINQLQAEYNNLTKQAAQADAEVYVSEESRRRLEAGRSAITPANAQGVKALGETISGLPTNIRTKYELDDQNAQAKLGTLAAKLEALGKGVFVTKVLTTASTAQVAIEAFSAAAHGIPTSRVLRVLASTKNAEEQILAFRALVAGVPLSKVVKILTTAPSAQAGVSALRAEIAALSDRTVTITTIAKTIGQVGAAAVGAITKHASGRQAGQREPALVGEGGAPEYVVDRRTGKGGIVDRPTLMGLGPDEYVIPLEQRYRGRALGLFAQLAADLEIPGYKAGKKPKSGSKHKAKAHRPIPGQLDPLSLPLSELEQHESEAHSAAKGDEKKTASLHKQIRTAERTLRYASKKAKPKAQDRLNELRSELSKVDPKVTELRYHNLHRELAEAKRYQAKIKQQEDLANIAANDMKLADGHDNQSAYDSAKKRRLTALEKLKELVAGAQKHVKVDSEYFHKLTEQVQGAELETQSTGNEEFEAPKNPAAEREEQSGMTDAEAARLKEINKNIALAALTPDLGDDKTRAQELVSFLETVLGEDQAEPAARGGDETITNIADQLKTARGNLESLSGSGTNENADLQAQINQANERAEVAQKTAQIAEQALAVFGGSGDIGAGGANAAQAAAGVVVHQTVNTLHPGDPATLTAIGNAATAGMGMQGSRRAVRERPGI
ncbi:MAG: phage tail tape measure protein [Solirubrobacteraceae bacterium]